MSKRSALKQISVRFKTKWSRIWRLLEIILEALVYRCVGPARRPKLTQALYTRQRCYVPDGSKESYPLFAWEQELIQQILPDHQNILWGGAGAGREWPLFKNAPQCLAFEPHPLFFAHLAQLAKKHPTLQAVRGSWQDVIENAGFTQAWGSFLPDLIYFGWGSWGHIQPLEKRLHILSTLSQNYPHATIVISAYLDDMTSSEKKLSGWLNKLLLNRNKKATERFFISCGFIDLLSPTEIKAIKALDFDLQILQERPYCIMRLQGSGEPWAPDR